MKQLFEAGECVILQSLTHPELNGEYHVLDVVEYGDIYECRITGELINHKPFNEDPFCYRLEEVVVEAFSTRYGGVLVENTWSQTALRKKQQKGDISFKELMSDLKANIQERIS